MKVLTFVKGEVPTSKVREFEAGYAALKKEPLPQGLEQSYLLKNSEKPETYIIVSIWESREALEKMRSSGSAPAAPTLFKKFGATPQLEIHKMVNAIRNPSEERKYLSTVDQGEE
ncbi:MAG: antibiotic biosynthesis monooxygenase [Thaumarchaeota archaeon]|nr:antibiotic biosynthesis monooxygenase [Nitrososphaerota archaeon]